MDAEEDERVGRMDGVARKHVHHCVKQAVGTRRVPQGAQAPHSGTT